MLKVKWADTAHSLSTLSLHSKGIKMQDALPPPTQI